jgi:hypothetical protein
MCEERRGGGDQKQSNVADEQMTCVGLSTHHEEASALGAVVCHHDEGALQS